MEAPETVEIPERANSAVPETKLEPETMPGVVCDMEPAAFPDVSELLPKAVKSGSPAE